MAEIYKHWRENIDQKYLRSELLAPGEKRVLTIKNVVGEILTNPQTGTVTRKNVLYFNDANETKPLALCTENCERIESLYGPNLYDWVGKKIQISVVKIKAFGQTTDAIRIEKFIPTADEVQYLCSVCGKTISKDYYDKSIAKYGKPYCGKECYEKDIQNKKEAEQGKQML